MAMPTADSLFQMPRIRPVLEHINIVIGFKNQYAAPFELLSNQAGWNPQIGRKTDFTFTGIDGKANRIDSIMRC